MKTERTFFEDYLDITLGPCPGTPPPGFEAFGTIRFANARKWASRRLPLYISPDGQRLIAGDEELTGIDLIFARAACDSLRNRRAACENDPRHRSKRRGHPFLQLFTANSLGGPFS